MGQTYLEILPKLGAACHRPDWFILDQKSIMKLNNSCRSIVHWEVAHGDTTLLWHNCHDSWNNDPLAYSLAGDRSFPLYDSILVAEAAEA